MSSASFYKWRAKYGGIDPSLISQMKAMEEENRRLKRMYADLSMKADLLTEALGKVTGPSQCREMAENAVARHGVSIALACCAFGVSETCYRYSPNLKDENEEISDLMVGLTDARKTWGFGLCFLHSRNVKGLAWNNMAQFEGEFSCYAIAFISMEEKMKHFVGLDVSMKETAVCVVNEAGQRIWEGSVRSTAEAIAAIIMQKASDLVRAGMETGPHAVWLFGMPCVTKGSWSTVFTHDGPPQH